MTATGQIVARGDNDYAADFEWAYITYAATDNISISAGRLRLPLFKYSASLDVGYSYHWVNAPQTVYNVPFNNIDGIRVDYSNYSGDWEYSLQFAYGTYETSNETFSLVGKDTLVFSVEAQNEGFNIRGVAGRGKSTFTVPGLEPIFAGIEPFISPALFNNLKHEDDTGVFLGLGLEYDAYDWFVSSEITSVNTADSFNPEDIAYYVTAGMRFGKWTSSLTYEVKESDEDLKFADQVNALPDSLRGNIQFLQGVFADDEQAITLGLRYDMDTNVALKADISKYTDDLNEINDATLIRVGVSYVF
ncbi:MAG: topoisomerase IV [Paraglaciecola sp.]|nr:topoisomerase IV [Paraglaciecola sp.]